MSINRAIAICFLSLSASLALAAPASTTSTKLNNEFYVFAEGGIFGGNLAVNYKDLTDTIPQNTATNVSQSAYAGGVGVGWDFTFSKNDFLGFEFDGDAVSGSAQYNSGSNTNAFSDTTTLKSYFDATAILGRDLTRTIALYIQLGPSYANVSDKLTSPVYTPLLLPKMTTYQSNAREIGVVAGLGISNMLTQHLAVFAQYSYHDFGTMQFKNYKNY